MVEASERFFQHLKGVTDPEAKRHIIGEQFIRVFEAEAEKLGPVDFLVQGTTYPDVIESMTSESQAAANAVAITLDTTGAFTGRPPGSCVRCTSELRSY